jgi:haloalkane dehalogenase
VKAGTRRRLGPDERAAYDAPFPAERYKAGARAFPRLVPTRPANPAAAANRRARAVLREWTGPFITAFSDRDPITRGWDEVFQREVPGAAGQPHHSVPGAGHFLQEDAPGELGRWLASVLRRAS